MLAAHPALFIGFCVVLGLLVGSFLNVVIYRVPVMMDNELRAECAALAADGPAGDVPAASHLQPRHAALGLPEAARRRSRRCRTSPW